MFSVTSSTLPFTSFWTEILLRIFDTRLTASAWVVEIIVFLRSWHNFIWITLISESIFGTLFCVLSCTPLFPYAVEWCSTAMGLQLIHLWINFYSAFLLLYNIYSVNGWLKNTMYIGTKIWNNSISFICL